MTPLIIFLALAFLGMVFFVTLFAFLVGKRSRHRRQGGHGEPAPWWMFGSDLSNEGDSHHHHHHHHHSHHGHHHAGGDGGHHHHHHDSGGHHSGGMDGGGGHHH